MGVISWFLGKGLVGAIAKDLCIKYLAMKKAFPNEDEETSLIRVWNFWVTLNEPVWGKDDKHKCIRFKAFKERFELQDEDGLILGPKNLMDVFTQVLYIESGVSLSDAKLYDNSLKVFVNVAKRCGLDYHQEFEREMESLRIMGKR